MSGETNAQPACEAAPAGNENSHNTMQSGTSLLVPDAGAGETFRALRSAVFRREREQHWKQLETLVDKVEKADFTVLTAEEARQLPLLYRGVVSALSVARHIVLDRHLLLYLENLSLRAYLVIYGPRSGVFSCLKNFLTHGFPNTVRGMSRHLLLAFLVFFAGIAAGILLVSADLNAYYTLVPDALSNGRGPDSTRENLLNEELFAPWPGFVETFIVFANSLFRHNTIVGLLSFGLGFALGIPTLLLVLYNGLVVGAFIALHMAKGLTVECIGWLSIHGVTEILAIMLCAAAGLVLAEKIIFPDNMTRLHSLAVNGRKAASVAAGAVLLFFAAGILEGGFRQLISNTGGRFLFAAATVALWTAYFTLAGRSHGHQS